MANIKEVSIYTEYIKLNQFLKIADLISSGGEDKIFIINNTILVNNEPESRRGRKLYKGDVIKVNDEVYKIC